MTEADDEWEEHSGRKRWSEYAASRKGAIVSLCMIFLQLGSCVVGLAVEETTFRAFTCSNSRIGGFAAIMAGIITFCLAFAWIFGIFALVFPRLRLAHWALVGAIPMAYAIQQWLVAQGYFHCHFHI